MGSSLFKMFRPCENQTSVKISTCHYVTLNSKTVFLSLLTPHLPHIQQATHMVVLSILWAWQSSAGRECREGQRETERQRGKKSIAIDMQHCIKTVTAQREKREGGMERLFYTSREPFERQRKIGEWKERDGGKKRVVIERKDLFDITREKEKERVGQEADEKGIVIKRKEQLGGGRKEHGKK